jgi:predicted acetyltransferase
VTSSERTAHVRLITPEEVGAWGQSAALPFLEPLATAKERERWEQRASASVEIGRTWAAEDHGRFVGNAGIYTRTVTLPGAPGQACPVVAFAAVTGVGVHPTHRRRGLLRRLMGAMLDDARERGEAMAGLTASESSIYGRFGYGWAVSACETIIETRESAFAVPAPVLDIELLVGDEAAKVVPAAFERAIRHCPGQVNRNDVTWAEILADREEDRHGRSARIWAVCDGGLASWRAELVRGADGDSYGRLVLDDLIGETPEIEAGLWRFALDVDLIRDVVSRNRPADEPLRPRLVDPRRLRTTRIRDFLWLRILDTPATLRARGYLRPGRLVLDVTAPSSTPTGPDGADGPDPAAGRWILDAGPAGSDCRAATAGEAADLTLGVAELSILVAGEVRATTLAAAGRIREERPGALVEAEALFAAPRAPLCLTGF